MYTKIYAPSALIIGGSVFVMVGGHYILSKRYVALTAAYGSLLKQYKSYRNNTTRVYGSEADLCLDNSYITEKDDGSWELGANDADLFIPDRDLSDWAVLWGPAYSMNLEMRDYTNEEIKEMARDIEAQANDIFKKRGHLFLYEVYNMLGIMDKDAPDGVGWCHGIGDDFVSFGIFETRNADAIMNCNDPVYWLDFNHDGYILQHI